MKYDELCERAKKVDPKVRFAGVINSKGRLVAGGMVSSKKPLEDIKKDEMLFMELALRVKMRSEFDDELGKVKFSLSFREKLIVMSFKAALFSVSFCRFCSLSLIMCCRLS